MAQQMTTTDKKSLLRNDPLLVCGMLAVYGVCILALIGATFWGLDQRNRRISTNATSTASIRATEQAKSTATAAAYLKEQDQYEFVERFDNEVSKRWFIGQYEKQYGDVNATIKDGVYIWEILDPKEYTQSTDFYRGSSIRDFNAYVDIKFVESSAQGTACSGFVFRKSSMDWEDGAYTFAICNDFHYEVYYYEAGTWDTIKVSEYCDAIQRAVWNRIGISAMQDQYVFSINNQAVYEMTDDRRKSGSLGLYIEVAEENSAVIWFDNFGFQSR